MSEASPITPRPRRRWLRFSLRTFFIAVTILCCWLGWKVNAARKQREAVAAIQQCGSFSSVLYDYQLGPGLQILDDSESKPHWLAKHFGIDLFHKVLFVRIDSPTAEQLPGLLPRLAALPGLRSLSIDDCDFRGQDFRQATELRGLEELVLDNCKITDEQFRNLNHLKNLRELYLDNIPINDESLASLASLPKLQRLQLDFPGESRADRQQALLPGIIIWSPAAEPDEPKQIRLPAE